MPHIRKQTKVWTSHTGRQVRICDMPRPMLVGTLKMLKRAGEVWRSLKLVQYVDGHGHEEGAWADEGVPQCICTTFSLSEPRSSAAQAASALGESWREHVPVKDFFDSMELEARRRGINWDDGIDAESGDIMAKARIVRDNMAKVAQYSAGSSRGDREADF